ncbi:MAG: chemoreceptor glutamine deamidase CheD [Betaproteobacteria bacterium]|nr:chemoreceptor glutamine deamidase CheD [Betaproteobacteria bacterium]
MHAQKTRTNRPHEHASRGVAPEWEEHLATNTYFDRHFEREAVKLLPGEYYATTRDLVLVTVLGSCVAACLRDRERGIGGMNHFMLPDGGSRDSATGSARYGVYAMEILVNHLLKMGASRTHLEAKVFGGGQVMSGVTATPVGDRNAAFVLDYLATEGIAVAAQDLLDVYPRKVYFFPSTGRVMVKKLVRVHNDTVSRREQEYRSRLRDADGGGAVELFT